MEERNYTHSYMSELRKRIIAVAVETYSDFVRYQLRWFQNTVGNHFQYSIITIIDLIGKK